MPALIEQTYAIVPIDSIQPHPLNPNRGDSYLIGRSMMVNGFVGAILVQASTMRILAGEQTWRVARSFGMAQIPVLLAEVDDDRARRILLVFNRLAREAFWDETALIALLTQLRRSSVELHGTGFTRAELRHLQSQRRAEHG